MPQNIDMEDKLIGPLTLVQFLYLISGGVAVYLIYLWIGMGFLFWILTIPIGLVALGMAFFKVQDQPLLYFIKAGIIYLGRPKKRIWIRHGLNPVIIKSKPKKVVIAPVAPKQKIEKSQLEQLALMLDTQRVSAGGAERNVK